MNRGAIQWTATRDGSTAGFQSVQPKDVASILFCARNDHGMKQKPRVKLREPNWLRWLLHPKSRKLPRKQRTKHTTGSEDHAQIAGEKTFAMTNGNGSREKRFLSTILTGSCGRTLEKRKKRRSIPTEMPSSSPFTETGTTPNLLIAAAANAWLYASIARIKREMAGDDRR